MVTSIFALFRKRRAIKNLIRKVGPLLQRRYGHKRYYSIKKVRRAAHDIGIFSDYYCYAYCIYCSRVVFDRHHQTINEPCDYDSMRAEVSALHFGGSTSFDALTAIDLGLSYADSDGGWWSSDHGHSSSSHHTHDASSSHHTHDASSPHHTHDSSHGCFSSDHGGFVDSGGDCGSHSD